MILHGDCRDILPTLPDESVHCVVTSPPYWGLRDYGVEGQIGLEPTPEQYVETMVQVFREVRRVLRSDGVCFVNLGDSYAGGAGGRGDSGNIICGSATHKNKHNGTRIPRNASNLKPKDLCGIPWRVAFALQADGWWLRQDIIWSKPNPMPESVTDRFTKSHEYVFLLSKSARYWFDQEAVKEQGPTYFRKAGGYQGFEKTHIGNNQKGGFADKDTITQGRNRRSVWTVNSEPYSEAHFATFPQKLIEPMILAGCPDKCCPECGKGWERVVEKETIWRNRPNQYTSYRDINGQPDQRKAGIETTTLGFRPSCKCGSADAVPGTVLDPFLGSGTVGQVCERLGRKWIGIELNPEYVELCEQRSAQKGLVL